MEYGKMYFHYNSTEKEEVFNQNDICEIYSKFADDGSRRIFIDRLMFSLTNDWRFIQHLLVETDNWSEIDTALSSYREIYIYGAGIAGRRLPLIFPEYPWKGYIDKNKNGLACNNLPVYGIEICCEIPKEAGVLISNMVDADKIRGELLSAGIEDKNILIYAAYTKKVAKNIYFEDRYLSRERMRKGTFVDAGSFDGTDTIRFFDWMNDKKNPRAIVFEADRNNYEIVKKNLALYPQIKIYNLGLSDVSEQKKFMSGYGEMSNFSAEGDSIIPLDALDDIASGIQIGYIKMDIEGFEWKALSGARKIITKQKPMLAVSIYHKREDIWKLPKLISKMNPTYKFFLRHYSLGVVDTVLYAI